MPTYAIGDVQGCREPLDRLLRAIDFSPDRDRLWFAGDLVNRGPDSLGVLRFVRSLGDGAVTVLGNHDLHLISRSLGSRRARGTDTLAAVLRARDRHELIDWLRSRPLLHAEDGFLLVHAGLAPEWTPKKAAKQARKVETVLRGDRAAELLRTYATATGWPRWSGDLPRSMKRLATLCYLTRVRCVDGDGRVDDTFTGPPEDAPSGLTPWYAHAGRRSGGTTVIFGHWAALGARMAEDWIALDSGCVWGKALTAVRLEDRAAFQVPAAAGA